VCVVCVLVVAAFEHAGNGGQEGGAVLMFPELL
jgi:hypothetical protein